MNDKQTTDLDRIAREIEALRPPSIAVEVNARPNARFIARVERQIAEDREVGK